MVPQFETHPSYTQKSMPPNVAPELLMLALHHAAEDFITLMSKCETLFVRGNHCFGGGTAKPCLSTRRTTIRGLFQQPWPSDGPQFRPQLLPTRLQTLEFPCDSWVFLSSSAIHLSKAIGIRQHESHASLGFLSSCYRDDKDPIRYCRAICSASH